MVYSLRQYIGQLRSGYFAVDDHTNVDQDTRRRITLFKNSVIRQRALSRGIIVTDSMRSMRLHGDLGKISTGIYAGHRRVFAGLIADH